MALATASDPAVHLALWAGIASLAASAAMLAAVVVLRLRSLAGAARERSIAARWQAVLVRCVESGAPKVQRLPPAQARLFLQMWNRMHESLLGESKERLNALARSLGADSIALRYLRSRNERKRLIAIVTLGNLREEQGLDRLVPLLDAHSPVVSLRSAQALLRIQGAEALPTLLAAFARRPDWPLPRVISVLRELAAPAAVGRALAATILETLASEDPQPVARLLRLVEAAEAQRLRAAVRQVLQRSSCTETVAAALAALRHPDEVPLARAFASHREWLVRMESARVLGRLGTRADLHPLIKLLGDANWWVRYRAAQALVDLPWIERHYLEHLQRALHDRFAADALRQAIAERQVR